MLELIEELGNLREGLIENEWSCIFQYLLGLFIESPRFWDD